MPLVGKALVSKFVCGRLLAGLLALSFMVLSPAARAGGPFEPEPQALTLVKAAINADTLHHENTRVLASGLAVLLGPFGAHRLYLGTSPKVAAIYGLTFGGFGVLALIDLGHLLFTKDLSRFQDNDHVLMWVREPEPTPP